MHGAATAGTTAGTGTSTVSLLVCFGERKRPISIDKRATSNELQLEIVGAFSDVYRVPADYVSRPGEFFDHAIEI